MACERWGLQGSCSQLRQIETGMMHIITPVVPVVTCAWLGRHAAAAKPGLLLQPCRRQAGRLGIHTAQNQARPRRTRNGTTGNRKTVGTADTAWLATFITAIATCGSEAGLHAMNWGRALKQAADRQWVARYRRRAPPAGHRTQVKAKNPFVEIPHCPLAPTNACPRHSRPALP